MKKFVGICSIALCIASYAGCKKPAVLEFEPNMVYAKALEIDSGYPMQQALDETQIALTKYFGTPDEPKMPEFLMEDDDYASLVSLEDLAKAAGSPTQVGRGLYQQHCATCHGVVGNGRGETAALITPYPRDYRMGKFKFKSTRRGAKPLRSDLEDSIKYGIAGTSMKVIPELTEDDISALASYVIYLSMRGEFERMMLYEGNDIDFEEADDDGNTEHLYDPSSPAEKFAEQEEFAQDLITDIADSWLEAEDLVVDIPEPDDIPVPETVAEVLATAQEPGDSPLKESIAKGKELFASELSACAKCHGKEGYGDGVTQDYDDWTKDWTVGIGIDPNDYDAQVPLIARGALPPRKIIPRDFREGLYRGGSSPEALYLRIAAGIDGTPMPAAALQPEQIWHIVNYIRSLAVPQEDPETGAEADIAPTEQPAQAAAASLKAQDSRDAT
ncbi:MAG: c-type cytochrome [Pirellulaceae bacterium]